MLVLSRHQDEQIVIDGEIVITIVAIYPDRVRIGIEAPADVPVHRMEIYEALQRAAQPDRSLADDDASGS